MTNEEFIKSITIEGEEWKDVTGYEGYYMVSSFGRVVSFQVKPRLLNPYIDKYGYYNVNIYKDLFSFVPFPSTEPAFETIGEPDNVFILVPVNTTITNRACLPVYPVDQIVIP